MKAVHTQLQIKRVGINKDDSVSFTAVTPALSDEELGVFRTMSKVMVNALLEPDGGASSVLEIKEKVDDGKSPSQRLRAVLFIWFEQQGRPGEDFEVFYRMKMNMLIDKIKEKLQ